MMSAYQVVWIWQGVDVTDLGFHLTNQADLYHNHPKPLQSACLYALTDIIGGGWLELIGEPSVIWARLGGVLVISCSALLSFLIWVRFFPFDR